MPYIDQRRREQLAAELFQTRDASAARPITEGELNYCLTRAIQVYLETCGTVPSYGAYNAVLGALEGCKLELYRRRVAPYEDEKIARNGDVW